MDSNDYFSFDQSHGSARTGLNRSNLSSPDKVIGNKSALRAAQQRAFKKLDVQKQPSTSVEFSTYYPPINSSTILRSTNFNSSTSSNIHNVNSSTNITSGQPTTSIIQAFRELQQRVKLVEEERYRAIQEKDRVQQQIHESRRNIQLDRNRREIDHSEQLLTAKANSDRIQRESDELRAALNAVEEIHSSLQRKVSSQKKLYEALKDDVVQSETQISAYEKEKQLLQRDLYAVEQRTDEVDVINHSSPEIHNSQHKRILHTIRSLEEEIYHVKQGKVKVKSKIAELQAYSDLIIKINGDLCDTLLAREDAKHKLLNLAKAFSPPPRYAWPKDVPYNNLVNVINEAAKVTAQIALESTAVKATEQALKTVIDSVSPKKRINTSHNGRSSRSTSPHRVYSHSTMNRHDSSESSSESESESDEEDDHRQYNASNRFQHYSSQQRARSHSPLRSSMKSPALKSTVSPHHSINHDHQQDHGHHGHNNASMHQSDFLDLSDRDDNDHEQEDVNESEYDDHARFLQRSSHRTVQRTSSSMNGRKKKRKGKRSGTSRSRSSDSLVAATAAVVNNVMGRYIPHYERSTISSRLNYLSGGKSGSSSGMTHRKETLQKVIARQGAITSATRLAAAATAASTAMRVNSAPSSPTSTTRPIVPGIHEPSTSVHEDIHGNRISFIPSSKQSGKEFNVVASVSKASRATRQLNATIASKVKSLHSGGVGSIFEEVPSIQLYDLQNKLAAVKKMRQSLS